MNTSTLDHSSTDVLDLIRDHAGREVPSAGTWAVGRGQRVSVVRRGLRRRSIDAVVLCGRLDMAHDWASSTFELTLMVADSVELVSVSTACPHPVRLAYCGVFHQRGRVPSLWLSVSATLPGGAVVRGDLNLNPA